MDTNTVYLTKKDSLRLLRLVQEQRLANGQRAVEAIEKKLKRTRVVAPEEVPPDAVTMNSVVRLREAGGAAELEFRVVYPKDASAPRRRVSVLAPIGTAVLGCRVGDVVGWPGRAGTVRYTVEEVVFQPEVAENPFL